MTPDSTAVRVALWRARHRELDQPAVFDDDLALALADPEPDWRDRRDMDPEFTRALRAAMASRARFVEELVIERAGEGVGQYVVLGAGLDTFAQRHPELAGRLTVFEIDQPGTQAWKRQRLAELGHPVSDGLRLVPVDFGSGRSWWHELGDNGFAATEPAVVVSTGVSMYLTRESTMDILRRAAGLAPGSTLAMTFLLPAELVDPADRAGFEASITGARAAGTPFVSLYRPGDVLDMAREAGLPKAEHVAGAELGARYFAGRADGLRPSSGEDFLIATT